MPDRRRKSRRQCAGRPFLREMSRTPAASAWSAGSHGNRREGREDASAPRGGPGVGFAGERCPTQNRRDTQGTVSSPAAVRPRFAGTRIVSGKTDENPGRSWKKGSCPWDKPPDEANFRRHALRVSRKFNEERQKEEAEKRHLCPRGGIDIARLLPGRAVKTAFRDDAYRFCGGRQNARQTDRPRGRPLSICGRGGFPRVSDSPRRPGDARRAVPQETPEAAQKGRKDFLAVQIAKTPVPVPVFPESL